MFPGLYLFQRAIYLIYLIVLSIAEYVLKSKLESCYALAGDALRASLEGDTH